MNLPGLQQLEAVSPEFARDAARLGQAAWTNPGRTPRETAAAFLGADLALKPLDLPLTLHTTMARQLGISDAYLSDVIIKLAPAIGYPIAAQALMTLRLEVDNTDPADEQELRYATGAARRLLQPSLPPDPAVTLEDIVSEYGSLRGTVSAP